MPELQYNKTYLIQVNKDLAVRRGALPVLQSKEAALRLEAKKTRGRLRELDARLQSLLNSFEPLERMWSEFPDIVRVEKIKAAVKKRASIKVRLIEEVIFSVVPFSPAVHPVWFTQAGEIIKDVLKLKIERLNEEKVLEDIEYARRKTTQKVNLYEKVQIPFFEEAIRKIKRFLEDEENLSKASQKVLKARLEPDYAL